MIVPAPILRKLLSRALAFKPATVELSATGGTLTVRMHANNCDAAFRAPCVDDLPPVVMPAPSLTLAVGPLGKGDLAVTIIGTQVEFRTDDGDLVTVARETTPMAERRDLSASLTPIPGAAFRAALARVVVCVPPDTNRYSLNGISLDTIGNEAQLVATDGNCLSAAIVKGWPVEVTIPFGYMIPSWSIAALAAEIGDDAQIGTMINPPVPRPNPKPGDKPYPGPGWLLLRTPTADLAVALNIAEFPDWRQVVPPTFKRTITADRDALLRGFRRVGMFGANRYTGRETRIRLESGVVLMSSQTKGEGAASARVPAGLVGEPFTLGLANRNTAQVLHSLPPGPVEWSFGDTLSPIRLRSLTDLDAGFAIMMPVRID